LLNGVGKHDLADDRAPSRIDNEIGESFGRM
jgi:hypothetical protein